MFRGKRRRESGGTGKYVALVNNGSGKVLQNITHADYDKKYADNDSKATKIPKTGINFGSSTGDSRDQTGSSHPYSIQQSSGPTFKRNEKNQLIISLNSPDDSLLSSIVSSSSNPRDTQRGTPVLRISTTSAVNELRENEPLQVTRVENEESVFKKRDSTSKEVTPLPEIVSNQSVSVKEGDRVSNDLSSNITLSFSPDGQNNNVHSLTAKNVTKGVTTEKAGKFAGTGRKNIDAINDLAREETGSVHSTGSAKFDDKIVPNGKNENSAAPENSLEGHFQRPKNSDGHDSGSKSNVTHHVQPTESRSTPEGNTTIPLVTGLGRGTDHHQLQSSPNVKKEGTKEKGGNTRSSEISQVRNALGRNTLETSVEKIRINGKEVEKKSDVGKEVSMVAPLLSSKAIAHKPGPLASSKNNFSVESPKTQEISSSTLSLGGHSVSLAIAQDIDHASNFTPAAASLTRYRPDDPVKYNRGFSGGTAPVKISPSSKKYPGNITLLQEIYKKPVTSLTKSDIRHIYLEMTEEQALRRSWRYRNVFRSLIRNRMRNSARDFERHERNDILNDTGNKITLKSKGLNKIVKESATSLSIESNVDKLSDRLPPETIQGAESSTDFSPPNATNSDTKITPSGKEQHTTLSRAEKLAVINAPQDKNDEQSVVISKDVNNSEIIHTRNVDISHVSNLQNNTDISTSNDDTPVINEVNLGMESNEVSEIHVPTSVDPEGEVELTQISRDRIIQENLEGNRSTTDSNAINCNSDSALESSNLDVAIISGKKVTNGSSTDLETSSENVSRKVVIRYHGAHTNTRHHKAHSVNDDEPNSHNSISSLTQIDRQSQAEMTDTKLNCRSPRLVPDDRISQAPQNVHGGTSDIDSFLVDSDRSSTLHRVKKLTRKVTELQGINLLLKKKLGRLSNEVVNYEIRLSSIVGMVSQMRRYKETMEEVCARIFTSSNPDQVGRSISRSELPDSYVVNLANPKSSRNKSTVESEFLSLEALIMKRIAEYKAFEISLMEKQEMLGEISEINDISVLSESPFVKNLKEKLVQVSKSFTKYRDIMAHRVENLKQELERTKQELASSREELGRHSRDSTKVMTNFLQLRERSKKDQQIIAEQKKQLEFKEQELKAKESVMSKNKAQEDAISQISGQNQQLIAQLNKLWATYRALYNQYATQQSKIQAYEGSLKYSHTQLAGLQEKLRLQNDEISRISNQRAVDYGPGGNLFWKSEYDKLLQIREKERSTFKAQISKIHRSYHKLLSDREKGYQAVIDSMNEIVGSDAAGTPSISAYPASSGGTHNSNTSNPVFLNTGTRNGQLLVEGANSNDTTVGNIARQEQAPEIIHAPGSLAKQPQYPTSNTEGESVTGNKTPAQRLFVSPDDNIPEPIKLRYTIYVPESTDDLDGRISEISRNSATEVQDIGS